jgi:hypothetical protein
MWLLEVASFDSGVNYVGQKKIPGNVGWRRRSGNLADGYDCTREIEGHEKVRHGYSGHP